jgi:hypothetical protein
MNSRCLFVEFVIRKLAQDQVGEQNATSQADGQPEKVDEGITFVLEQISYGDAEVVFEHGFVPVISVQ